jgi:hypothetical protein
MKLQINRNTFYDPNNKRFDCFDNRYYFKVDEPDIFYPSVTTILECWPKGYQFAIWQQSVGLNANVLLNRAAEKGSHIHDAIHKYLKGEKIIAGKWDNVTGNWIPYYTMEEWEQITKFVEFWSRYNPKLIATEVVIISDAYQLGGTIDIICEINEQRWAIDAKSGGAIYDSHELQIAAYAKMWNDVNPDYCIDRCGVLHLDALTRGEDKSKKKIQGKGWQIKEFDRHYGEAWKVFKSLHAIWKDINPDYKPVVYSIPTEFQLAIA